MAEPFIGEIRIFGSHIVPAGWAQCNGQFLSVQENVALYSLITTIYGGDGVKNFALPNLQARVPLNAGQGPGLTAYQPGDKGGAPTITLRPLELANHSHAAGADSSGGGVTSPENAVWGAGGRGTPPAYVDNPPNVAMSPESVQLNGGDQPHNNLPPYLVLNFCIALVGLYPVRP